MIVSQLVRSPGAYYDKAIDQTGKYIYNATVIPNRGAWIELETDSTSAISVRIDRTRKMPVSYLLRALDFETNEQIIDLFDVKFFIASLLNDNNFAAQLAAFLQDDSEFANDARNPLTIGYINRSTSRNQETFNALLDAFYQIDEKNDLLSNCKYLLDAFAKLDDKNSLTAGFKALIDMLDADKKANEDNKEKALIGIYNRLRPGEPPSAENSLSLMNSQFFDPRRYDLANVGRYKITKKLGWKRRTLGKILAEDIFDLETGELLIPKDTLVTQTMLDAIDDNREAQIFGLIKDPIRRGFLKPIPIKIKTDNGSFTMLCTPNLASKENLRTICIADIISSINYVFNLMSGSGVTDDIDHLGNRRVRSVGELLQNQFRIGMTRMERVVRERMTKSNQIF